MVRNRGTPSLSRKDLCAQDCDLRCRIVEQHHDSQVAGHPGRWKTLELVSRNYWWPQMSCYIGNYVQGCDLCIHTKIQRPKPIGKLGMEAPWPPLQRCVRPRFTVR